MIPSTEEFERLLKLGGIGENTIQDWYKEPTKFQDSFCAAVRTPNLSVRFFFVSSLTSKALNTQCYFLFAGEELRYDYKNQFQPWKQRKNWSKTESGWQFLHNVPKDGSFQVELPDSLRHSPFNRDTPPFDETLALSATDPLPILDDIQTATDPLSMEDSEAVDDNKEDRVDLFSPIRKKLRGMSLYAKTLKGNDDARSVSSKSETKSGTITRPSTSQTSSLKSTEGTTSSSDNFSDTSASSKRSSTERHRNRNENREQEMSSQNVESESEDHGEVPDNDDCSISSQSEVQAQQDSSIDSRISQSVKQNESQIELSENSQVATQSSGENSEGRATAVRKVARKRLSTLTISAAKTSVQKKRKQSFLLYGLKKTVTSLSLQIVPKNIGTKTKWVKSNEVNNNVLNQLLSEGHQAQKTTLSKTLSDIEEEPVQPELTPSCSYSNEGLERRNTLSSTPLCVDQRRANLDDLDETVSDQKSDSETSDDETNNHMDVDSESSESEKENSDEENRSWEPDESDFEETEPLPRKKTKLAKAVIGAKVELCRPQTNLDASSDKLSTERGSIAESISDDRLNSSYNSSIKVPQVDDCIENTADGSGIQILRHGTYVTKRYPCGMCGDGTWFTKPQRHFVKSAEISVLKFQIKVDLRSGVSNQVRPHIKFFESSMTSDQVFRIKFDLISDFSNQV